MNGQDGQGIPGGESQGFSGGDQGDTGQPQGGMNPAWSELLAAVPEDIHSQVIPHLQKWDKGVQDQFQKVHSQYEGYRPFIDQQIAPDELEFSLGLLNAVNQNPYAVREALNAWIESEGIPDPNAQQPQGQPSNLSEQGQNGQVDLTKHPEFQQMQQVVQEVARQLVDKNEQEQQRQADAELAKELADLKAQHGEYDERFVLARMQAGMTSEEAVKDYFELVNQIRSGQRQPGPKVMGAGGSLPQNNIDVRKLDGKDRRSLVENMLRNAAQQE